MKSLKIISIFFFQTKPIVKFQFNSKKENINIFETINSYILDIFIHYTSFTNSFQTFMANVLSEYLIFYFIYVIIKLSIYWTLVIILSCIVHVYKKIYSYPPLYRLPFICSICIIICCINICSIFHCRMN